MTEKKKKPKAHYAGGNDDKWRGCASGMVVDMGVEFSRGDQEQGKSAAARTRRVYYYLSSFFNEDIQYIIHSLK